ncbi:MAG TPA: ABC transporter permease [Treponemataceae bacterium]|nr:ABC transporter permease [Treponemataceae bacterium]HQL32902.1 ABC transporter permease [Treponemataceae bacterium]
MLILKIVTRNIFAHARKNLIICAVTACVSLFLFLFLSFSDGEMENVKNGVSGFFMPPADIYVTHTEFRSLLARNDDKKLRDATVHNAEELKTLFAGVPDTTDVPPILLHESVRSSIPVKTGDILTLVATDLFGQISTARVRLAGFFEPVQDNVNLYSLVLIPSDPYARFPGYNPGETNRLIIIATSLITLFITAFGIMNVTSTNLADRKKEIGTYYCLGSEPPFLMAVYTLEIFIVNLAGSLAGIGTGLIVRAGINALKSTSDNPGFLIVAGGSTFTLGLSAGTILWIIGGISLLTVLTALTTLGKALNVSPVVAVKETEQ